MLLLKQASAEDRYRPQNCPRSLSHLSLRKVLDIKGWLRDAIFCADLAVLLLDPVSEAPAQYGIVNAWVFGYHNLSFDF